MKVDLELKVAFIDARGSSQGEESESADARGAEGGPAVVRRLRPRGAKSYGILPIVLWSSIVASMHGDAERIPVDPPAGSASPLHIRRSL